MGEHPNGRVPIYHLNGPFLTSPNLVEPQVVFSLLKQIVHLSFMVSISCLPRSTPNRPSRGPGLPLIDPVILEQISVVIASVVYYNYSIPHLGPIGLHAH